VRFIALNAITLFVAILLLAVFGVILTSPAQAVTEHVKAPALLKNLTHFEQKQFTIGKNIYRNGQLPSGQFIEATTIGDVTLPPSQVACSRCHGRSGLGASEGGIQVLPVTAQALFTARGPHYRELKRRNRESVNRRKAYTDKHFARAIRDGIDPNGRTLGQLMPRYRISNKNMDALRFYISTLSSQPDPGVTQTEIHFATIVSDGVDPVKSKAMLDLLRTFLRDKNAGTRHEKRRADHPPWHKQWHYPAYRRWILHLWTLKGPGATWLKQLEDYYRQQPVFAVVSGIAKGSWQPVHQFCEQFEVPCLFPNTDLPNVSESDFYSLYFSKGLTLEAQSLAKYLIQEQAGFSDRNEAKPRSKAKIVQVFRDNASGHTPAGAFNEAMKNAGVAEIENRVVTTGKKISAEFWENLIKQEAPSILVLWLPEEDINTIDTFPEGGITLERIFIPSSMLSLSSPYLAPSLSSTKELIIQKTIESTIPEKPWWKITSVIYAYRLPEELDRGFARTQSWLKIKGLPIVDKRVQGNTFVAVTLLASAIKHIMGNFSRDYLIEKLEHKVNSALSTSVYPHLSLAPGQRFASRGCYILGVDEKGEQRLSALSDWLIP
jgi:hypothetical protein